MVDWQIAGLKTTAVTDRESALAGGVPQDDYEEEEEEDDEEEELVALAAKEVK